MTLRASFLILICHGSVYARCPSPFRARPRNREIRPMPRFVSAILCLSLAGFATPVPAAVPFDVRVEVEEIVCELPAYDVTNNGSGMFWGSGSAQMVRVGDRLFVSAFAGGRPEVS